MPEAFSRELQNKSASRDDDSSGVISKMARVLTQPNTVPKSPSGQRGTPSAARKWEQRVRRQRVLPNVSSLGEIYLVDMSIIPSLLDTTNYALMSDNVNYIGNRT